MRSPGRPTVNDREARRLFWPGIAQAGQRPRGAIQRAVLPDAAPAQVWATLLAEGVYLASQSTLRVSSARCMATSAGAQGGVPVRHASPAGSVSIGGDTG